MKKVEPREANSLKLVPTAQQGRSWSNLLRKRLQALPTYFGRFSSLSSSYITLTTSTNTSSSCPTALNSPSPVCIALPTCFSSSLSVSSFTLPTTSLCSSTFSSRLCLDCNCQQIIRIATILLTCSISSSFSSSSLSSILLTYSISSSFSFSSLCLSSTNSHRIPHSHRNHPPGIMIEHYYQEKKEKTY